MSGGRGHLSYIQLSQYSRHSQPLPISLPPRPRPSPPISHGMYHGGQSLNRRCDPSGSPQLIHVVSPAGAPTTLCSDARIAQYCPVLTAARRAFSALTLLVGRQEGRPACKNRVVGCWHGYLSGARCRLAYGPADATATHCLLLQ